VSRAKSRDGYVRFVQTAFRRQLAVVLGAGALALAAPAPAAEDEVPEAPATRPASTEAGGADLDRLLKLPEGQSYGVDRRGGLSRGEWRNRFTEVRTSLDGERQALAQATQKLDEAASSASNWQMAPIPGMEASPDAPLSYELRLQIRRHKSEIDRLEKKLRELEIEANLAGVPEDWRS